MLASLKHLLIQKIVPITAVNFCSELPSLLWVTFYSVHCTLMAGFRNNFQNHHSAFGATFRVTGSYWKAGTGFLKSVTGRILKIISDFVLQKNAETLFWMFFTKRQQKNCENHQRSYKKTKYCLISRTLKKYHLVDTILLKRKYFKHI